MAKSRPHVALIIETSKAYGRGVLRGIARYVRANGPWSIYHEERSRRDPLPPWLETWRGDGIIVRGQDSRTARPAMKTPAAVVDLGEDCLENLPRVESDNLAIARLAAEHLIDRGFQEFGYVGSEGTVWSARRQASFLETIHHKGGACSIYQGPAQRRPPGPWERSQDDLAEWLRALPKPAGVMAANDAIGLRVLEACRRGELAVPEEVAVVGVDNDEVLCDLAEPPLSSVAQDLHRIGYEAAALLDRLMAGEKPPEHPACFPPLGVVTRQSTDLVAIADPKIAAAVRYIREHACDGIGIEDVARRASLSRRALERRFVKHLGRPPHSEIFRVRLDRVKVLLIETELPLKVIAAKAGFQHVSSMCTSFKKKTGRSPGQYRKLK